MNSPLRIKLNTDAEQTARLVALQAAFAQVCNALAPLVQQTRVWNRVALHHLSYRDLRTRFPALGSQMVCNAIYSVSRTCRVVFQSPASPFNLSRLGAAPLPLLRFTDTCPVYFDRHTLSLKSGQLSMFTLDGRMRFQIALGAEDEQRFRSARLAEVVLSRRVDGSFELTFSWAPAMAEPLPQPDTQPASASVADLVDQPQPGTVRPGAAPNSPAAPAQPGADIPEYIVVEEAA